MRAVVVDPSASPRLAVREADPPTPGSSQAVIRVQAFSINPGETRAALAATTRYTPGWDFAGVIERAAADSSSPAAGTRVFGFGGGGAWAELIASPAHLFAALPDDVSTAQAAALPVAGVTALVCLERAGALLGRRVLITGAAGGVGRFACQLAARAGAQVFAISRRAALAAQLADDGVTPAGIFASMADAKRAGTYDVILDSVGGDSLATALTAVGFGGVVVNCGNSSQQPTTFDAREFYLRANARLDGVWLGAEQYTAQPRLQRLAALVAQRQLRVPVAVELPWTDIAVAADRLLAGEIDGKLVLTL